jgi:hypothetical protein
VIVFDSVTSTGDGSRKQPAAIVAKGPSGRSGLSNTLSAWTVFVVGAALRKQLIVESQPDSVALAHSTFSKDALSLTIRSAEGILRRARNLCVSTLFECGKDRTKTVELKQVNSVLLQPHWRRNADLP